MNKKENTRIYTNELRNNERSYAEKNEQNERYTSVTQKMFLENKRVGLKRMRPQQAP